MPWAKGQSGNPGGRPKTLAEVKALAQKHTLDAIKALVKIATKGKNEGAVVSAANSIMDRAYGKPTQPISGDADAPPISAEIAHHLDPESVKMLEAIIFKGAT